MTNSAINLDKFKYDLVEGWREVMDSKNPIDWAIFGYDGQSFDLKLVSKGMGGIEEMVDNFNSGRIMYGLCRVKIKDRNIEKIALINWQGEGAPLARKGTCANHLNTVKHFFKGIHVTINARTDEDVDPDIIRGSIAKTTSAEGVCSSPSMDLDQKLEPVGALYKKLNPQEEINAQAKDEFWRKEEAEEESRKKKEKTRVAKFNQNEVKLLRKESQDYFEQEQMEKAMSSPMTSPSPPVSLPHSTNGDFNNGTTPSSEATASVGDPSPPTSPTFSNTFVSAEKAAVLKASVPRKNPENLVRQRIKSFDASPNERLALFNAASANGNVRASSKSPSTDGEGEQLSVMKRKAMFESGIVSNTSQNIVKKDPAQEIKSLQEESQNQAKTQAAKRVELSKSANATASATPHPASSVAAAAPPITKKHHALPPTGSAPPAKPAPHAQPTVKAYNLPFHIGGGVSSRLAEKVNKNSSDETERDSIKANQNGNGNSSLSSLESSASKNSIPPAPASITVAATAARAEFQADPIPQHITTNFKLEESTTITEPVAEVNATVPDSTLDSFVPSKSPIPNTVPVAAEAEVGRSLSPSVPVPVPAPTMKPNKDKPKLNTEFEDTTVQSGEIKKTPSPLPPVSTGKEETSTTASTGTSFVIKPEMGLCARALYDYQAADESEISFDPGEIVTNIETIDEGWWEGMGPHGVYGLFPSNYVELLN